MTTGTYINYRRYKGKYIKSRHTVTTGKYIKSRHTATTGKYINLLTIGEIKENTLSLGIQ